MKTMLCAERRRKSPSTTTSSRRLPLRACISNFAQNLLINLLCLWRLFGNLPQQAGGDAKDVETLHAQALFHDEPFRNILNGSPGPATGRPAARPLTAPTSTSGGGGDGRAVRGACLHSLPPFPMGPAKKRRGRRHGATGCHSGTASRGQRHGEAYVQVSSWDSIRKQL